MYTNGSLRPGLCGVTMTFNCAKHGCCCGWHLSKEDEGLKDVHAGIYGHWEKAPKVIASDYSCNLMPYCRIREYEFYKDTRFAVDLPHFVTHLCSNTHNISYFRENDEELLNFQDVIFEQHSFTQ